MRVKVCGITNLEDALMAIDEGADAVGFIFYERSIRYISPDAAARIIEQLPPFVEKVGLFIDSDVNYINKTIAMSGITLAQIHFQAMPALYGSLIAPHLRVVRPQRPQDVNDLADKYRLVDIAAQTIENKGGGLDLDWFKEADCSKIILSGGLTPENVAQARDYGFYGVDVNMGVESEPGKKDRDKIRAFIRAAKQG